MGRPAAEFFAARSELAIVALPFKLDPVRLLMGWHPRMDAEPAHLWFRTLISRAARDWKKPWGGFNRSRNAGYGPHFQIATIRVLPQLEG
jgi:hypothetical protein